MLIYKNTLKNYNKRGIQGINEVSHIKNGHSDNATKLINELNVGVRDIMSNKTSGADDILEELLRNTSENSVFLY